MEPEEFQSRVKEFQYSLLRLINKALPLEDAYVDLQGEAPGGTTLGTELPLRFNPPGEQSRPSDLYSAEIEIGMGLSRDKRHLAVLTSCFALLVGTAPILRFEYEKKKTSNPAAHLHISGVGTWLSPALMINRPSKRARQGKLEALHIPVGGHRFRPSIEDFLYFLIHECGFEGKDGWKDALTESREHWRRIQLEAVVRDDPKEAARTLEALGYIITPPEGGHPPAAYHPGW